MPSRSSLLVIVALGVALCAGCAVVLSLTGNGGFAGVAAAIAGLALLMGLLAASMIEGLREAATASKRSAQELEDVRQQLRVMDQHLELLRSSAALSERTKSVLGRGQERMLLAQAIEDDIAAGRLASASMLARQLDALGASDEAATLSAKVREAQRNLVLGASAAKPVHAPPNAPPQAMEQSQAAIEAAQAAASAQTAAAQLALQQASLKNGLEQAFHAAAREGRTDDAMMVLGQLDSLITPEEAAPLREIARDVIAKARDGLGEKFRAAIQEKRWKDAVPLGEQIARQFPNTRMATEVSGVLEELKKKAVGTGQQA